MSERYDVVVIGGGAAGLSGALTLARSRRSVLVVDAGEPRNAPAEGVHNYLGREGTPPGELLAAGRAEVTGYGGEIVTGTVTSAEPVDDGFRVTLAGGRVIGARRLLVTTGLTDELPPVPGVAELWGRDVLHCPFCHGWEHRDQAIGVLATTPMAMHQALMWRQLSPDVTLFQHTGPALTGEQRVQLAARGIVLVEGEVEALETAGGRLTGVRLRSGEVVARQALVVGTGLRARDDVLTGLGLKPVEQRAGDLVIGHAIAADPTGATEVPGVWVAGNVTDVMAQVIGAAAAGLRAGAAHNGDLVAEDTRLAVDAHLFGEAAWEERYRARAAIWSGRPNAQLVAEAAELPPGTALDVGSGEGADAIWLAERGWQVTAADISTVAIERARGHAEAAGVAGRIEWAHTDITAWAPPEGRFDLVSAHFMHLPEARRRALHDRLAAAVAPGGTLLIVGHHPLDLQTTMPRMDLPGLLFTAEEIAAGLDPGEWEVQVTDARPRPATDPEGREVTIHDAVLRARRRG